MSKDIKAGGAYVELMLRDKKFLAKLGAAGQKLVKFAKFAAVAGVAAGAAAVGGVAVATRQYIKMGDELDKMSKRTGVSVEALSELKHAAGQSGASAQDLEKGLAGLSRSLFDAGRGSKEANDALAAAGVTLAQLQGLSPEKQMALVANGLKGIADESTKGAVAQRIFGRAGRQLLPLLREGAAGMQALRDQAREAGLTMSTDAASGAARLLDAFSIIGSQAKVMLFEVGAAAAPFVEQALPYIQAFSSMAIEYIRMAGDYISSAMSSMTGAVTSTWQAVHDFVAPITAAYYNTVYDVFSGIWDIVSEVMTSIGNIINSVWTSIGGNTGSIWNWMQETIMTALAAISFAFTNWKLLLVNAVVSAELGVVRFAAQVKYFFTEVIPAVLKWLYRNWYDIFKTIGDWVGTVASNIWKNLQNLWTAIEGLFSGDGFNFEWTGLTEGFKSSIQELPKIAKREMGPLETQLQREMDALGDQLNEEWNAHSEDFKRRAKESPVLTLAEELQKRAEKAKVSLGIGGPGAGSDEAADFDFGGLNQAKKDVFATFSAAAAAAQGHGGGKEEKIVDAIKDADRKQAERDRKLADTFGQMVATA